MDEPRELQRWATYVDAIDADHVHLVMADETVDRGDEREIGTFPRHLFEHLDIAEGRLLTVRVMSDRTVSITDTPIDERLAEESRIRLQELLDALPRLLVHLPDG